MRTNGQTDRHDEANSRFSQFCECAKKIPASIVNRTFALLVELTRMIQLRYKTPAFAEMFVL